MSDGSWKPSRDWCHTCLLPPVLRGSSGSGSISPRPAQLYPQSRCAWGWLSPWRRTRPGGPGPVPAPLPQAAVSQPGSEVLQRTPPPGIGLLRKSSGEPGPRDQQAVRNAGGEESRWISFTKASLEPEGSRSPRCWSSGWRCLMTAVGDRPGALVPPMTHQRVGFPPSSPPRVLPAPRSASLPPAPWLSSHLPSVKLRLSAPASPTPASSASLPPGGAPRRCLAAGPRQPSAQPPEERHGGGVRGPRGHCPAWATTTGIFCTAVLHPG